MKNDENVGMINEYINTYANHMTMATSVYI